MEKDTPIWSCLHQHNTATLATDTNTGTWSYVKEPLPAICRQHSHVVLQCVWLRIQNWWDSGEMKQWSKDRRAGERGRGAGERGRGRSRGEGEREAWEHKKKMEGSSLTRLLRPHVVKCLGAAGLNW